MDKSLDPMLPDTSKDAADPTKTVSYIPKPDAKFAICADDMFYV